MKSPLTFPEQYPMTQYANSAARVFPPISSYQDAFCQLLSRAIEATNADAGTVYLLNEDNLSFVSVINDSLGICDYDASKVAQKYPPIPLVMRGGADNNTNVATYAAINNATVVIDDIYADETFDFQGPKFFDDVMAYKTKSMFVTPIHSQHGQVLGILQLINAKDTSSVDLVTFDDKRQNQVNDLLDDVTKQLTEFTLSNLR